ncbi:hypothetical protein F4779DRAFT_5588 [Xylariaceae sp. FL0662B]|nr:hypothetical protein F4779DRAFT_5588 [Xylariaceae sp. FL0662B]
MNKLPLELHDRIVQFVGRYANEPPWVHWTLPKALPAIAAVSRNFQQAVERLTFRNLRVSTSPSDLDAFRRTLTPQRQRNLRRLAVHLCVDDPLPCTTSGTEQPRKFATDEERRAINESTTTQLREFFNILAGWRLSGPSVTLVVDGPRSFRETLDVPDEAYFRFSMLDVSSDLTDFQPLPMVKQLYVNPMSCHLHPHLVVCLTAKMPNVSHVSWDLSTCYTINSWGLYHYMPRIWRDGLVQSIESTTLPPSVEKFSFNMFVPGTSSFQILPNFIGSSSSPDPVSSALRKLTKDCTEVYIEGSIHPLLFDPFAVPGTAPHEAAPAWKKVTRLEVKVSTYGPDGEWLVKLDPDNDPTPKIPPEELDFDHLPPGYGTTKSELDEAEEYYEKYQKDITPLIEDGWDPEPIEFLRIEADDGPMNALLAAFARGCGRGNMPALRTATFQSEFHRWTFWVTCCTAGTAALLERDTEFADGDRNAWCVFFYVGNWRPAEETLEEFRQIGRERTGRDTTVRFLPQRHFAY